MVAENWNVNRDSFDSRSFNISGSDPGSDPGSDSDSDFSFYCWFWVSDLLCKTKDEIIF